MLKQDLILQIINQVDHCLDENNKKIIGSIKDKLGEKIMKNYFGLK